MALGRQGSANKSLNPHQNSILSVASVADRCDPAGGGRSFLRTPALFRTQQLVFTEMDAPAGS